RIRQNPGILAPASLRRIYHQRPLAQSDASQSAWEHVDFLTVKNVRPEVHVTPLEMIADQGRHAGQGQRGLSDVVTRIRGNPAGEILALFGGGVRAYQHTVAACL